MYTNILVPVALDHDRDVDRAIAVARVLLSPGGRITALTVMEELPSYASQYLPEGHAEAQKDAVLALMREKLGFADDIEVATVHGPAGQEILHFAETHDKDLIVVASHRPGLQDYFLGSTAARVVRHATCAVHVVR